MGISEKTKEYKRALQKKKKKSTVLCVPPAPAAQFLATLSPISFYFSGVYNVISAEGLTRSLRFVGSAGKMQNDRLSNNGAPSPLFTPISSPSFYALFSFAGRVPLLREWAQKKATENKQ